MVLSSLFKSKKNNGDFAKQLEEIDRKIKEAEDRLVLSREFQKRLKHRILFYSFILEIVIGIYTYTRIRAHDRFSEKLLNSIFLIILPVFIYFLSKSFGYVYNKFTKRNELKLEDLKKTLQKKLDERKKETDYEATQKLIDKYEKKKNREQTPTKNNNNSNTQSPSRLNGQNNKNNLSGNSSTPVTYRGPNTSISPQKPIQNNINNNNNGLSIQKQQQQQQPQHIPSTIQPYHPPTSNHWFDKIVDYLLADGPKYGAPLICAHCHSHNGYVPSEELSSIQFRCRFCHEFNQKGSIPTINHNSANSGSNTANNINNNNKSSTGGVNLNKSIVENDNGGEKETTSPKVDNETINQAQMDKKPKVPKDKRN